MRELVWAQPLATFFQGDLGGSRCGEPALLREGPESQPTPTPRPGPTPLPQFWSWPGHERLDATSVIVVVHP